MLTQFHYPKAISPTILDDYLAKGWYRMGQSIFTTKLLCLEGEMYSTVWIRLDLRNYTFRKSLRKLYKKNSQRFRIESGDFKLDEETEALFQKHRVRFEGFVSPSLRESLLDSQNGNIFNTKEFKIYDGDQLIAASFFDLGKNSVASIMGLFDPDYEKHSLGFFTMLLEIQYCQKQDLDFYYPGYVVPRYPNFDYKLRIGDTEYYDLQKSAWLPLDILNKGELPAEKMYLKLKEVYQKISDKGIEPVLWTYPFYDKMITGIEDYSFLQTPLFLLCKKRGSQYFVVAYDYQTQLFKFGVYEVFEELNYYSILYADFGRGNCFANFLEEHLHLLESTSAEEIANEVEKYLA